MHLTLKREAIRPPGANSLQQQGRFDRFAQEFNTERPHQAIAAVQRFRQVIEALAPSWWAPSACLAWRLDGAAVRVRLGRRGQPDRRRDRVADEDIAVMEG
jgi:hypothetical protein